MVVCLLWHHAKTEILLDPLDGSVVYSKLSKISYKVFIVATLQAHGCYMYTQLPRSKDAPLILQETHHITHHITPVDL